MKATVTLIAEDHRNFNESDLENSQMCKQEHLTIFFNVSIYSVHQNAEGIKFIRCQKTKILMTHKVIKTLKTC